MQVLPSARAGRYILDVDTALETAYHDTHGTVSLKYGCVRLNIYHRNSTGGESFRACVDVIEHLGDVLSEHEEFTYCDWEFKTDESDIHLFFWYGVK